jgi:hypothetical protein
VSWFTRFAETAGAAWLCLEPHVELVTGWLDKGVLLTRFQRLLARQGTEVPYRTSQRFAVDRCELGAGRPTVPVDDGEPGCSQPFCCSTPAPPAR